MTWLLLLFEDSVWFKERHMDAMLTKGGLVIVNFTCQLDWKGMPRLNIISGYICESVSRRDWLLNW